MNTTQSLIIYGGLGIFAVLTLAGGYTHVIPPDTTITLFSGLVGSFVGLHVPSPLTQSTVTVKSTDVIVPDNLGKG